MVVPLFWPCESLHSQPPVSTRIIACTLLAVIHFHFSLGNNTRCLKKKKEKEKKEKRKNSEILQYCYSKIWVAKLGMWLIFKCGLSTGVYGSFVFIIKKLLRCYKKFSNVRKHHCFWIDKTKPTKKNQLNKRLYHITILYHIIIITSPISLSKAAGSWKGISSPLKDTCRFIGLVWSFVWCIVLLTGFTHASVKWIYDLIVPFYNILKIFG